MPVPLAAFNTEHPKRPRVDGFEYYDLGMKG